MNEPKKWKRGDVDPKHPGYFFWAYSYRYLNGEAWVHESNYQNELKKEAEKSKIKEMRRRESVERRRKKRNSWYARRRERDPAFIMIQRLRCRTRRAITSIGGTAHTMSLLGASWSVVREWIECQFVDGMSWDNIGEWHIDHIIPLCTAGKDPAAMAALCHYTNLRPLYESENLRRPLDLSDLSCPWPRF